MLLRQVLYLKLQLTIHPGISVISATLQNPTSALRRSLTAHLYATQRGRGAPASAAGDSSREDVSPFPYLYRAQNRLSRRLIVAAIVSRPYPRRTRDSNSLDYNGRRFPLETTQVRARPIRSSHLARHPDNDDDGLRVYYVCTRIGRSRLAAHCRPQATPLHATQHARQ